jgi:outer membrane protein assembly factor BamB
MLFTRLGNCRATALTQWHQWHQRLAGAGTVLPPPARRRCHCIVVALGVSLAALLPLCALSATAHAQAHWPQFRGPGGRAVAEDGHYPIEFGPEKNLLWKTPLPSGHSSPCVWEERIFVTGFDEQKGELETLCLERSTGAILWRRAAPTEKIERVHAVSSPAAPTPATDGRHVYVYFGSFGLLAYDFDGNEGWRIPLPTPNLYFGTGASPIVVDQTVLLNIDEEGDSFLLAVDGTSGNVRWKTDRPLFPRGWATPLYWRNGDVDEIVVSGSRQLTAYALKDGTERWFVHGLPMQATSTPVAADGMLFATVAHEFGGTDTVIPPLPFAEMLEKFDADKDGAVARTEIPEDHLIIDRGRDDGVGNVTLHFGWMFNRFDPDKNGKLDRDEWSAVERFATGVKATVLAVRPGGTGDVSESHVLWKNFRGVPEVPSCVYNAGRLFMVKKGGVVTCLDARTGEVLSTVRLRPPAGYYASPVIGDGKIYAASVDGVVTVFEATSSLKLLAQNALNQPVMATPALADGKIYLRTATHLYAFGP